MSDRLSRVPSPVNRINRFCSGRSLNDSIVSSEKYGFASLPSIIISAKSFAFNATPRTPKPSIVLNWE